MKISTHVFVNLVVCENDKYSKTMGYQSNKGVYSQSHGPVSALHTPHAPSMPNGDLSPAIPY